MDDLESMLNKLGNMPEERMRAVFAGKMRRIEPCYWRLKILQMAGIHPD